MTNNPFEIYLFLHKKFGAQGWWPVTPAGSLKPVYRAGKYKVKTPVEKLEICIGAILTQNTAWANVEKALVNLNRAGLMSVEKLAGSSSVKLQNLIKPSGYFVQKTKKIKIFCDFSAKNYNGDISKFLKKPGAELRKDLLGLWGIGAETADSILLYAAGRAVFVIDGYTVRISKRLGWFKGLCYRGAQKFFMLNLPKSVKIYNEFHALLVLLGKNFCKPKPLCNECPLNKYCLKKGVVAPL